VEHSPAFEELLPCPAKAHSAFAGHEGGECFNLTYAQKLTLSEVVG
jgi:hypothetical protein